MRTRTRWSTMAKQELSLAEIVENFHTYNRTGKSEQTCRWYRQRVGDFLGWLSAHQETPPTLADFTLESYRRYVVHLKTRIDKLRHNPSPVAGSLSPRTINGHQRALRTFASFLASTYRLHVSIEAGFGGLEEQFLTGVVVPAGFHPREFPL